MDHPTRPLGTLPPQLPQSTHYVTPAPTNQAWCAPDDSDPDEEPELPPIGTALPPGRPQPAQATTRGDAVGGISIFFDIISSLLLLG